MSSNPADDLRAGVQLPEWLNPERFEDPKFNPEAIVADLRRHVSGNGSTIAEGCPYAAAALPAALTVERALVGTIAGTPQHRQERAAGIFGRSQGAGTFVTTYCTPTAAAGCWHPAVHAAVAIMGRFLV